MRVNMAYVEDALGELVGTAQYEHNDPLLVPSPDEPPLDVLVTRLLDERVIPEVARWLPSQREKLRAALRYALNFDRAELDMFLIRKSVDFQPPTPSVTFFEPMWERLFPGEAWRMAEDENRFEVVDDPAEVTEEWANRAANPNDPWGPPWPR